MDLTPYLEAVRRDLAAAAAPGGPDTARAVDLLANSLEPSLRLCLMEALSDAAAEITTKLESASVEVRLRGRDADLVINQVIPPSEPVSPPADPTGDVTRMTLRLPESLKESVERAAAATGVSVNAWLVRAIGGAVSGATAAAHGSPPGPAFHSGPGRRITGFARS